MPYDEDDRHVNDAFPVSTRQQMLICVELAREKDGRTYVGVPTVGT